MAAPQVVYYIDPSSHSLAGLAAPESPEDDLAEALGRMSLDSEQLEFPRLRSPQEAAAMMSHALLGALRARILSTREGFSGKLDVLFQTSLLEANDEMRVRTVDIIMMRAGALQRYMSDADIMKIVDAILMSDLGWTGGRELAQRARAQCVAILSLLAKPM